MLRIHTHLRLTFYVMLTIKTSILVNSCSRFNIIIACIKFKRNKRITYDANQPHLLYVIKHVNIKEPFSKIFVKKRNSQ